mmetsp:Transcript_3692/g.14452  ORF Transcript_3692/g.14452 Transcript_3692/m.14452 type:complete len:213 (+) Transcript_3692:134-772(+)
MHAALVVHARRPDHRAAALHVPAGAARHRLCLAPPRSVVRRGGASARVQTAPRTARRLGTNRRRRNPQLPAPPQRPRGRVASQVCPVPLPPGRRVLYLACRIDHGVAVRNDGRVVTWGSIAADRDSPTDAGYVSVACGQSHSLALHRDGRVVTLGDNSRGQRADAPTDAGYVAIACGCFTAVRCARTAAWSRGAATYAFSGPMRPQTRATPH